VALTAVVELRLRDAELIDFFDQNVAAFRAHAARAYAYAYENVHPSGMPLRRDDVAASLIDALEVNDQLRTFLAERKLRQKFWYQSFADLILDRLWEDLKDEHKQTHGD
jgi:hypothetical protein